MLFISEEELKFEYFLTNYIPNFRILVHQQNIHLCHVPEKCLRLAEECHHSNRMRIENEI